MSDPEVWRVGDSLTVHEHGDQLVIHRVPPGVTSSMWLDPGELGELLAWVEDNRPEMLDRLRPKTLRPLPPVRATGAPLRTWTEEDGEATMVSQHFYFTVVSQTLDGSGGEDWAWWVVDETERLYGPCATLEEAAEAYVRNLDYLEKERRDPMTGKVRNARDLDQEPNSGAEEGTGGP